MHTHNTQRLQLAFFIIFFIVIAVLTSLVFLPFFNVLAVSAILAVVMQPFYRKVLTVFRKEALSAGIVVLIVVGIILSVLAFVGSNIFEESRDLYFKLSMGDSHYIDSVVDAIENPIRQFFPQVAFDVKSYIDDIVGTIGAYAGKVLTATAVSIFNIVLGIVAFFYLLKDGAQFKKQLIMLSPLKDEFDQHIFQKLEMSVNAVVKGTLFIAMIQGFLVGLGMFIFGVPNATLWGSVAVIGAVVPGLGTGVVIIPAVIYLLIVGSSLKAFLLALWGILMVGFIDNLLAPFLYGKGTNIHPLIILFSVLGGISFFGPIGFLFGPLVVSLLYVLLRVYRIIVLRTESEETLNS